MKRTLPISFRIFAGAVFPVLVALAAGSVLLTFRVSQTAKSGVRETLADSQRTISRFWSEVDAQQQSMVGLLSENPALKAGLVLMRDTGETPATVLTLQDQLHEIHTGLSFDLMVLLNADQTPVASSVRTASGVKPMTIERQQLKFEGILKFGGGLYRAITVPVNLQHENIGYLVVGRMFDLSMRDGFGVLLENGRVVRGNVRSIPAAEVESRLNGCTGNLCEMEVGDENWVGVRTELKGVGPSYQLWVLRSVDAAAGRLTSGIQDAFIAISFGVLVAAGLVAMFASKSVARPLTRLVEHLRQSARTGSLRPDFDLNSSTREVNELAAAFNSAAAAIADSQRRLDDAYLQFTQTMAQALDARDPYTAGHSARVTEYALRVAKALNMSQPEMDALRIGANLHDLGKIGIPDIILQKNGRLTETEFEAIKQHPVVGRKILESVARFREYLPIVELHHENHDGSGYPWGLKDEQIPLAARIVHVVDAFDAMTSDRPYRGAMPMEKALDVLRQCAGAQFDPVIVETFLQIMAPKIQETAAAPLLPAPPHVSQKMMVPQPFGAPPPLAPPGLPVPYYADPASLAALNVALQRPEPAPVFHAPPAAPVATQSAVPYATPTATPTATEAGNLPAAPVAPPPISYPPPPVPYEAVEQIVDQYRHNQS